MYNPESQLDELLQNDNNNLRIKNECGSRGNEISGRLSLNILDQDGLFNSIIYSQKNFRRASSIYEDNESRVEESSYITKSENHYQDSSTKFGSTKLEFNNTFQNDQKHFGTDEIYNNEESSSNAYNLSGYQSNLFDKIHFNDFGNQLGRTVENDTSLPIANIGRLMKSVLPNTAKIAKQAKDMIRDCVTEFIFFISSEASDLCNMERRKTLNADDIFIAMNKLGFEHYDKPLKMYHSKWREIKEQNMSQNNQRTQ